MEQNNPNVYVTKDPVGQLIIKIFVHLFLYFPSAMATAWGGMLYVVLVFFMLISLTAGQPDLHNAVYGVLPDSSFDEKDIFAFVGWVVFGYAILSEVASLVRKPKNPLPWRKALLLWVAPAILGWTIVALTVEGEGVGSGMMIFCAIHVVSIIAALVLKRLGNAIVRAVASAASDSGAVPPRQ